MHLPVNLTSGLFYTISESGQEGTTEYKLHESPQGRQPDESDLLKVWYLLLFHVQSGFWVKSVFLRDQDGIFRTKSKPFNIAYKTIYTSASIFPLTLYYSATNSNPTNYVVLYKNPSGRHIIPARNFLTGYCTDRIPSG